MRFKVLRKLLCALSMAVAAGSAFASGVDSFGGGLAGEQQLYNLGKATYAQKLGCGSCNLAGKPLDKSGAQLLLSDASKTSQLSDEERAALAVYLKLRFKL